MKTARAIGKLMAVAIFALLAAGPARAGDPIMSLQPLHPGREAVLEPEFEGVWVYASENVQLHVSRNKEWFTGEGLRDVDAYTMLIFNGDATKNYTFEVHLVRLGSTVFADIQQSTETGLFALYPHAFAKIRVDADELQFDFLADGYVKAALENGRTSLAHAWMGSSLVLTAPSQEVQNFVESCAFDEEAFGDENISFTRLKEQPGDSQP